MAVKIIFWASLFIIFYSYIGYGILIWLFLKIKRLFGKPAEAHMQPVFEPRVTLVVASYNEAEVLTQKIQNSLDLDYPEDKLQIYFITDGSNDNSTEIISAHPRIKLFFKPEREGKVAAINRVMPFVTTPIVVFSDANTFLNKGCIREIVKHYSNEKTGAVAGEKKVLDLNKTGDAASAGEGLYWKYESFLKKLDAEFYSVVGAAGELFSIRTELFEPTAKDVLLDDFIISLKICQKGYRVAYEPNAYASEAPSDSIKEEQKRKIRISAGGFQSVVMLKSLLNIFKYGRLSFQYISHRVLRWVVCPFLLPVVLISNLWLVITQNEPLYSILLALQVGFYLAALLSWLFSLQNIKVKLLYVPYYFVFMNLCLYIGLKRFLAKKQSVLWEKAKRKS